MKFAGSNEQLAAQNEMAPVYTIPDEVYKVTVTQRPPIPSIGRQPSNFSLKMAEIPSKTQTSGQRG